MNVVSDYRGELLDAVEAYLRDTDMSATVFGKLVLNDPRFVHELREGREPRQRTMQRVVQYMRDHPANSAVA